MENIQDCFPCTVLVISETTVKERNCDFSKDTEEKYGKCQLGEPII
jgi:hypothetical protein